MTKSYIMNNLIEKMQSSDQDFRYMGLNDLMNEIKQDPSSFSGDEPTEMKVLQQVMQLVQDNISEVKNQAVKCLGQLIKILRESQMDFVVDKLIEFSGTKDDELRDISGLALKTITSELPPDGKVAIKCCDKLTPKLLAQLAAPDTPPETLIEALSILSILISRFPAHLRGMALTPPPLAAVHPLLAHARPAVRKRAILALAQVVPITPPGPFGELLQKQVLPALAPGAGLERQRTTVQLVAAVARHTPAELAPVMKDVVPSVVNAMGKEDEELRESALQALALWCPTEIAPSRARHRTSHWTTSSRSASCATTSSA